MKILTVITELGPGGAEKIVADLAHDLKSAGHENVIVSLKPEPTEKKIINLLQNDGIRIIFLNSTKNDPFLLFRLRSIFKRENPDLIHSHLIHPNILSRLANIMLNIPLVNTIHIAEQRSGQGLFFKLDKWTFKLCGACTAVSEAAARHHEKICELPTASILVIYNAVNPVKSVSPECSAELRKKWNIAKDSRIFGMVGRLDHQKGFDRLFARLPKIADFIPDDKQWTFLVLGDGPEGPALQEQLFSLNLPAKLSVQMPGFRADAHSLMNMFNVLVMPSRYEGYGLALAEAMTFGIPVVCSNVDSLPELCAKYKGTSILLDFESASPKEVFDALYKALHSGRAEPQILMSSSEMLEAYMKVYKEVCTKKQ